MSAVSELERIPAVIHKLRQIPPLDEMKALLEAVTDEDINVQDLARLIEASPAIAARVVGMANSAFYGFSEPVHSVKDAIIQMLGLNQVRLLVVGLAANASFNPKKCPGFNTEQYWSGALLTAYLARQLAAAMKTEDAPSPNNAYLCGLLHNIGIITLAQVMPERMGLVFAFAKRSPDKTLSQIESEIMGINHYQAGSILADSWGLPEEVQVTIEHYSAPDYHDQYWQLCNLVGYCTRWVKLQLKDEQSALQEPESAGKLAIDHDDLVEIVNNSAHQVEGIIGLAKMMVAQ